MKKIGKYAVLFIWAVMVFTGCGQQKLPENVERDTLIVMKSGEILYHLTGDFDKNYYDLGELTSMATDEADAFNQSNPVENGTAVVVEKVEKMQNAPERVVITYRFSDCRMMSKFLDDGEIYYGSVSTAVENGYGTGDALLSVKDGSMVALGELEKSDSYRLLVTDLRADIYCPGKIKAISEGIVIREDGSANCFGADGLTVILLK